MLRNFVAVLIVWSLFIAVFFSGAQAADILVVSDSSGELPTLVKKLTDRGFSVTQLPQSELKLDGTNRLEKYAAVVDYIHKPNLPKVEKALIAYARGGGRLVVVHHAIASAKMQNPAWLDFLGVDLFPRDDKKFPWDVSYLVDYTMVNLAPGHFVTTNKVGYNKWVDYSSADRPTLRGMYTAFTLDQTEIFHNQRLREMPGRTILFGYQTKLAPEMAAKGRPSSEDSAGWCMPTNKGWTFYFMPGHLEADFENNNFAQLIYNAIEWDPKAKAYRPISKESKTVRASDFGFNAEDSTVALQAAIDSGAPRVIVDRQKSPWIVGKTIRLRGNQEIVFEKGTVVLAKKGAFLGTGDALFRALAVENLTLRGDGATLAMRKADYHQEPYKKAEWRHALSVLSSRNVRVLGLELNDSGGDGIYLGVSKRGVTNQDVLIQDVACLRNNRQGISVISARNLLIENARLNDTAGTAPAAGIDFEPNGPTECLIDCVMRNCVCENNEGCGYAFYLPHLDARFPITVRLENCLSRGNKSYGLFLGTYTRKSKGAVQGAIEIVDCTFDRDLSGGIVIRGNDAEGCRILFENCRLIEPMPEDSSLAAIQILGNPFATGPIGNIHFENLTVVDSTERKSWYYGARSITDYLDNVSGTIVREKDGKSTTIEVSPKTFGFGKKQKSLAKKLFERDWTKAQLVPRLSVRGDAAFLSEPSPRLRREATFLIFASGGDSVVAAFRGGPVGKQTPKKPKIQITGPAGKSIDCETTFDPEKKETLCRFKAPKRGLYRMRLLLNPGSTSVHYLRGTHPASLTLGKGLHLYVPHQKRLYFVVPKEAAVFAVSLCGAGAERAKGTLCRPDGSAVETQDNISDRHDFVVDRTNQKIDSGEVWSLLIERPTKGILEDVYFNTLGLPKAVGWSADMLLEPKSVPPIEKK
jgi:Trehalose utilisation/Right handed beta helix region